MATSNPVPASLPALVEPKDEPLERPATASDRTKAEPLVVEDLLVEDVSIDGMCGVY